MPMDKLKGLLDQKKQSHKELVGERKWLKRTEVEQLQRPAVRPCRYPHAHNTACS